ncbi:hypothetical protein CAEBREN_06746 [Caenorhabditis brenneri]|uniref:Uncharacterized protein n=1 Tax=Caenorhabditis brenneri TaxID=135651 RepID=G0MCP4_CAEBE|nr:hypothetical protein CAEBREN_06746 [Caenorhabditis brenneri]
MSTPGPSSPTTPGPKSPSTERPSNPSTPGACSSNGGRPQSLLDSNIYSWTQKTRLAALKKKQDEETQELIDRTEMMKRMMVGMPEEVQRDREQQLENERNILDHVHHYQREYPDVAPDVINSIYLSYLEVPKEDRPEFDEYLTFKQKLMDLENRIFKLPPDQLDEVLEDNGGSLAVVFLNVEHNPLRVLDEGGEEGLEVEPQQFGYRDHEEEEFWAEYEEFENQEEEEEEVIQEDGELEEEYGDEEEEEEEEMEGEEMEEDEEEVEEHEEEVEEDQEYQDMDQEYQQMDMVEDVQEENIFAPIEDPVQYDANQLIYQEAEMAEQDEEEERVRRIRERFRQEHPNLMRLLESE